jgi:hypothetical protein
MTTTMNQQGTQVTITTLADSEKDRAQVGVEERLIGASCSLL